MQGARHEPLRAKSDQVSDVETASNYLLESDGDAHRALHRVIADALADLLEFERRSQRAERLLSSGYIRGRYAGGRRHD